MDFTLHIQRGFTLIELLVVIAIVTIIIGFSVIGFQNYAEFQQYNQAVSDVTFQLNETRLSARSAEGDVGHGIKILSNSIVIFPGNTYTAGNPQNVTYTYPLVTLTPTLSGGTDTIVFEKLSGLPSATGSITVTGVSFSDTATIEVTETGVIQ